MDSIFGFVIGLLQAALALIGFVQQHPELPQASRDQAQQVAQQAITQATKVLQPPGKIDTASGTWKEYLDETLFRISFIHPAGWDCSVPHKVSAHNPDWIQIGCDDDSVGDPSAVIDVPYVSEDMDTWKEVRTSKILGPESSVITKREYSSRVSNGVIGMVEYVSLASDGRQSYRMFALYGLGKPYASAQDAERTLDRIAAKLTVNMPYVKNVLSHPVPSGVLSANPISGTLPLAVTFTINPTDADYSLDFGDGSRTTFSLMDGACVYGGCVIRRSHTYERNGTYTVTLTQIIPSEQKVVGSTVITVSNTAVEKPSIAITSPTQNQTVSAGGVVGISWRSNSANLWPRARVMLEAVPLDFEGSPYILTHDPLPTDGTYSWDLRIVKDSFDRIPLTGRYVLRATLDPNEEYSLKGAVSADGPVIIIK